MTDILDEFFTAQELNQVISSSTPDRLRLKKLMLRDWIILGLVGIDSTGKLYLKTDTSGKMVVADSAALAVLTTIDADTGTILTTSGNQVAGNPLAFTVGGTAQPASNPWLPFAPITRTADAAGNPGAAAEIVAASAGKLIEIMIWAQTSAAATSGCYKFRYCEKTGTPGNVSPPWGALVTPSPLGGVFPVNTFGIRLSTVTAGENFGVGTGVNGDYTNNASVTFFGFYRYI